MTPLAQKVARELTLPLRDRTFDDDGGVLGLFDDEMHCFEVSAIARTVGDAMDTDNLWPEIETMAPATFLPSPVTWLEMVMDGSRVAYVLSGDATNGFRLDFVIDRGKAQSFSMNICTFRALGMLGAPGARIDVTIPQETARARFEALTNKAAPNVEIDHTKLIRAAMMQGDIAAMASMRRYQDFLAVRADELDTQIASARAKFDIYQRGEPMVKTFVGMTILILDLINTPGLVGLHQHDSHRALAKKLAALGIGHFPLRAWSEVVVKTHTEIASGVHGSGTTFRKCLHFVRSHKRHYWDGHVTVIPAHWRGDPALGIKRTRYRVADQSRNAALATE